MRRRLREGGFSLVEVVIAIAIIGVIVVPVGSAFSTALRVNARADELLRAQLAVSSAVERLMAEKVDRAWIGENGEYPKETEDAPSYGGVIIRVESVESKNYYNVTVSDVNNLITVETQIREKEEP